ncbi:MAG: hypothetical protein GY711_34745 [bacterium]|nr:hypothetical protein [bacterium]
MDERKASLSCGTLILIALIVLIVGNAGSGEVMEEVEALRRETQELSNSVERLHGELREVKQLIRRR